jgi:hypothetical protein
VNTYSPLWSKVVHSSLWRENDAVVKVFLTMIAVKDSDHIVRLDAMGIGNLARKDEAETLRILAILQAPDTKRIEKQPFDGRRIEKVADGWLVLNGDKYREMMRTANRNAYQAQKQREYRNKKKFGPSARERQFDKAHGDGDTARANGLSDAMHDKPVEQSQNVPVTDEVTTKPTTT